jgi:hypothetical protein
MPFFVNLSSVDYVFNGRDCYANQPAVVVLWAVNLALFAFSAVRFIWCIASFARQSYDALASGRRRVAVFWSPAFRVLMLLCFGSSCGALCSLTKLTGVTNVSQLIGKDVAVTILYGTHTGFFIFDWRRLFRLDFPFFYGRH